MKHPWDTKLNDREKIGNYRRLPQPKPLVDFCSNDYLGFAKEGTADLFNGIEVKHGATGSRLISGNSPEMEKAEQLIADFHEAKSGLIFNSGYTANLGLLSCLPQRGDTILFDRLVHASIRDGINLSKANAYGFMHNDLADLQKKLQKSKGNKFIMVESVYSMDGDQAPLKDLVAISEKYQAFLLVDEAHAVGVFGAHGKGLVVEKGLQEKVFARVVTFGKSLGAHGAIILGTHRLREYLINFSRPFIYTTALPLASLIPIMKGYDRLSKSTATDDLKAVIRHFYAVKSKYRITGWIESNSAIQSIIIPGNYQARSIAQQMQEQGYDLKAILHPTVPEGQERLRICLHTFNTFREIEDMLLKLSICLEQK